MVLPPGPRILCVQIFAYVVATFGAIPVCVCHLLIGTANFACVVA